MSLSLTINAVEKIKSVQYGPSFQIENIITQRIDSFFFSIRSHAGDSYTPVAGQEVIMQKDGSKIFGGIIIKIQTDQIAGGLVVHKITCSDYTRLLDQKLVPDSFENQTAAEVISSIITDYAPAGFTTTNVVAPVMVDYVGFNYKTISQCLNELARLLGYDWYVDYDKDIHFFAQQTVDAPVDIQDDNGTLIKGSLKIRRDNSQVRNSIVVRGGEYLGSKFTTEIEADGIRSIYDIPYKYSEFQCTLSGNVLNVGQDYLNEADDYDALHNFTEKLIRFKDADKPSAAATMRVSGKPYLPVIVKIRNTDYINSMATLEGGSGEYEHLIVDNTIDSKEGARQRAEGEMKAYGETLSEGEFVTTTAGLLAGQRIRVNSTNLGIDEYFIINKVTTKLLSPTTLIYSVSLITTRTADLVSVLQKLILRETQDITIAEDEIIDLVESYPDEEMTLSDVASTSTAHNLQPETATIGESSTAQALDYAVEFVVGPYTPAGFKRLFCIGGSKDAGGGKIG